jgi:DNA processing protein
MNNERTMYNLNLEAKAALRLHSSSVGSASLRKLRGRFGDYVQAVQAPPSQYEGLGLTPKQIASIMVTRDDDIRLRKILTKLNELNAHVVLPEHTEYPELLRDLIDRPELLYIRGSLSAEPGLSIVGTRKPTSYGRQVAIDCAKEAARIRLTVVSGLAYGIDAIAHQSALNESGHTVAVMPSSIETISPAGHTSLACAILKGGGALISEFPLGMTAFPGNFLFRNRIIAAISSVTLVVEGTTHSGALATAGLANGYSRQVWAVPGNIYSPYSAGPNALLSSRMADPFTNLNLIADYYDRGQKTQVSQLNLDRDEKLLIQSLDPVGTHIDTLVAKTNLDIASVSSKLILLELKGLIRHEGAGVYRRII